MRLLLPTLLSLLSLTAQAQKAGDKVQIESTGSWYPGKVLEVKEGQFFVAYDGWSETFNEWVGPDRIKGGATEAAPSALTKFKVGDKVEVEYGMVPEPATIMEVGENKYHIKYDNSLFGDKWVAEGQIKKL
ncbi:MAG: hypothetical protein IPG10_10975 [Flavobacteriales bacterium]|jgi:hypothetical protein|nr:hypothetical protein [Flavobacteriales bacterium]MBK6753635.1 hypothetical protein [Flavobacteriales bacterium]MBK7083744.1 hypothetical protein [Flavobacteriales bacterium]MBK7269985.1 hypothetical protein [Flavobacteriales bacterium]MBK7753571.1 hypothetical protein [Flavobacteriales bacterium]